MNLLFFKSAVAILSATAFRAASRLASAVMGRVFLTLALSSLFTAVARESSTGTTTVSSLSSPLLLLALEQPASMLTAMMPASAREAIFLSFIMNFSSLWCIKDRDPKQVQRKVLSFVCLS